MGFKNTLKRIIAGPELQPIPVLGRNDRCWCGSEKKYKQCHMASDDRKRASLRTGNAQQSSLKRGF